MPALQQYNSSLAMSSSCTEGNSLLAMHAYICIRAYDKLYQCPSIHDVVLQHACQFYQTNAPRGATIYMGRSLSEPTRWHLANYRQLAILHQVLQCMVFKVATCLVLLLPVMVWPCGKSSCNRRPFSLRPSHALQPAKCSWSHAGVTMGGEHRCMHHRRQPGPFLNRSLAEQGP